MSEDGGLEIAAQTIAASVAAGASLRSPELGAAAIFLTPMTESILRQAIGALGSRRRRHVGEALIAAANARSETVDDLITRALEDEGSQELFVRVATAAQDAALREKRVALGRALAAGLDGAETAINDELLFVRAIADLDGPHIQLLHRMSEPREGTGQMAGHTLFDGWTVDNLTAEVPALAQHLPSLLATLAQHGLITSQLQQTFVGVGPPMYAISAQGRLCLERLALPLEAEQEGPDRNVPSSP